MRRLDGLEEALAGKLFDRTPDGFQATALAAELLPIAQGVEETLNEAERRLVGMDAQLTGGIKFHYPCGRRTLYTMLSLIFRSDTRVLI